MKKITPPVVEEAVAPVEKEKPVAVRRRRRLPYPDRPPKTQEERRERQRLVCAELLKKWVPLATSEALALAREVRGKPVIEEEAFETGLKAGAFVLKVLERLARLDGVDAAEKREMVVSEFADPLELARRVRAISPLLTARLALARGGGMPAAGPPVSELPGAGEPEVAQGDRLGE
ncbi:MAG TPA: hypothetical protein VNQ90_19910 [Chthoniobacteraceae bacterium]|nr:hypothetical protein [Chthoniobacteraceae bacterium]